MASCRKAVSHETAPSAPRVIDPLCQWHSGPWDGAGEMNSSLRVWVSELGAATLVYATGINCLCTDSTSSIRRPSHCMTGTAIESPSALYRGPSFAGLPRKGISV